MKDPRIPERIDRAAVLGAGIMGAAIAAHLANVGIPTLLLDMPPREGDDRNSLQINSPVGFNAPGGSETFRSRAWTARLQE